MAYFQTAIYRCNCFGYISRLTKSRLTPVETLRGNPVNCYDNCVISITVPILSTDPMRSHHTQCMLVHVACFLQLCVVLIFSTGFNWERWYGTKNTYLVVTDEVYPNEVSAKCLSFGGTVTSILSQAENDFIQSILVPSPNG